MLRTLPTKRSENQNLIISAVKDFCDEGATPRNIINASLWIMKRRARVHLDDYEKDIVWYVEENLKDEIYCKSLLMPLGEDPTK